MEEWLKENWGYPEVYPIPDEMKLDYHPVFRNLLVSTFPFSTETGGTKKLVGHSRSDFLDHRRIFPHYLGITDPVYSSRARHNFGLVQMKVEEGDFFSRSFYNIPFPFRQKLKRLVLAQYGITKHGRSIEQLKDFPRGGVFLLNPTPDPDFDKLTKYRDYHYVALKVRFPKNYREWLLTVDGSVLISKSAAKLLRYKKIAYAVVRNPSKAIAKKFLLWKKNEVQEGARVEFQEPLMEARIGDEELTVATSPVDGYVTNVINLTPRVKDPKRVIWAITLEDERDAEIGDKLESATGLKNTIADFVDDKEPVIVINPDMFKDRSLYWEVKETGKAHVFITLTGRDGNISNRGARISNTLIQGIFAYPEDVREKLIEEIFRPENLIFPYPHNILKILEDLDIDPEKSVEFFPMLYYVRTMKDSTGKVRMYEQESKLKRALDEFRRVGWKKLPPMYKNEINSFIKTMTGKLLLGDRNKRCSIRLRALQRIVLWHDRPETDVILMGRELIDKLGNPEYVIVWKEPVSRQENIRCLKVEHDPTLDGYPQAVRIHPYLGKDYGENAKVELRAKIDTDGDLLVILPARRCIEELQYGETVRFKMPKMPKSIDDLPEPEYNYEGDLVNFLYEIYEYQRYRSIESELVETFGGLKNYLMYTDVIKDTDEWNRVLEKWDIELQIFQLEKVKPELKNASYRERADELLKLLKEAKQARRNAPEQDPFAKFWLSLPEIITYENFHIFPKAIRELRKQRHPVLQLYARIYETLGLL